MRCTLFVAFFCLVAGLGGVQANTQAIRKVAFTGESAPGTSAGVTFGGFSGSWIQPGIDNLGRVFFFARLQGPGVERINDTGLWMQSAGGIVLLVAREFDNAPGYSAGGSGTEPTDLGTIFRDFMEPLYLDPPNPKLSGAGHALVRTDFFGYDENEEWVAGQALYRVNAGELELVAGTTMPAPGTVPPSDFWAFRGVELNSQGKVVFRALIPNPTILDESAIWTDVRGDLELVVQAGKQVPGMPDGVTTRDLGDPVLNTYGKLAFGASIREPDASAPSKDVILAGVPKAFGAIVREGDEAPGTAPGVTFDRFVGSKYLDDAGKVFFQARIAGSEIDDSNNNGFWLEDTGTISLIAREGDQAPGLAPGAKFAGFDARELANPLFCEAGKLALNALLTGEGIDSTNDAGIWVGTPDALHLLVQEGDPAPGIPGESLMYVSPRDMNRAGRLALSGLFSRPVGSTAPNMAIWAEDINGQLQLIVKSGDMLEVAPGDFREVWQLQFGGFNDQGQVVFQASFMPGTSQIAQGIFVSNLVAVPEPSSFVLASACLAACGAVRRGK